MSRAFLGPTDLHPHRGRGISPARRRAGGKAQDRRRGRRPSPRDFYWRYFWAASFMRRAPSPAGRGLRRSGLTFTAGPHALSSCSPPPPIPARFRTATRAGSPPRLHTPQRDDGIVLASAQAVGAMALPVAVAVSFHSKVFDGFALGILLEPCGRGEGRLRRALAPSRRRDADLRSGDGRLGARERIHAFAPLLLGLFRRGLYFRPRRGDARAPSRPRVPGTRQAGFLFAVGSGILAGLAQVFDSRSPRLVVLHFLR